jgi:hypothetical protein
MYQASPATKLRHLFGKVRSLPTQHQQVAIVALAEIIDDFWIESE